MNTRRDFLKKLLAGAAGIAAAPLVAALPATEVLPEAGVIPAVARMGAGWSVSSTMGGTGTVLWNGGETAVTTFARMLP